MAITVTDPDGSPLDVHVPGDKRLTYATVTFDTSYVTGGYTVNPSDVGLTVIDALLVLGTTSGGRAVVATVTAGVWKIKVFAALAVEVVNATTLAGVSCQVLAIGS